MKHLNFPVKISKLKEDLWNAVWNDVIFLHPEIFMQAKEQQHDKYSAMLQNNNQYIHTNFPRMKKDIRA